MKNRLLFDSFILMLFIIYVTNSFITLSNWKLLIVSNFFIKIINKDVCVFNNEMMNYIYWIILLHLNSRFYILFIAMVFFASVNWVLTLNIKIINSSTQSYGFIFLVLHICSNWKNFPRNKINNFCIFPDQWNLFFYFNDCLFINLLQKVIE